MTVRIHRTLDSETLYLPEIRPLIGKSVEIIVREESSVAVLPATIEWDDAMEAVDGLEAYDFDALDLQRDYDLRHARDHLP